MRLSSGQGIRSLSPFRRNDPLITYGSDEQKRPKTTSNSTTSINMSKLNLIKRGTMKSPIAHRGKISIGGHSLLVLRALSSRVYEVGHNQNHEQKSISRYALKCIPLQSPGEDSFEVERRARLEISALRQVNHENIIPLLDEDKGEVDLPSLFLRSSDKDAKPGRFLYLLSPIYDTNLEDYVNQYGPIHNEKILSQLFGGICSGVEAIHVEGMRHNDINPKNILLRFSEKDLRSLSKNPENSDYILPWPIISNFETVSPVTVEISSRWQAAEVAEFHLRNSEPAYRAPEIWKIIKTKKVHENESNHLVDGKRDTKNAIESSPKSLTAKPRKSKNTSTTINSNADAFSVGCTLYFMLFKRHAFKKITSNPTKQPSKWLAFIPSRNLHRVPQLLLYTSLGMMLEISTWRLDITKVLSTILPKGELDEHISRGIWAEYQGAPGLNHFNVLRQCKGMPLTLTVPQSPVPERGLNRRAVRMLGKGGTSVVKSLSMVEEVPISGRENDRHQFQTNHLSTIDDNSGVSGSAHNQYQTQTSCHSETSPMLLSAIGGSVPRTNSLRSDFHSLSSDDETDANSFISWSEFREPDSSVSEKSRIPLTPKRNEEMKAVGLNKKKISNNSLSPDRPFMSSPPLHNRVSTPTKSLFSLPEFKISREKKTHLTNSPRENHSKTTVDSTQSITSSCNDISTDVSVSSPPAQIQFDLMTGMDSSSFPYEFASQSVLKKNEDEFKRIKPLTPIKNSHVRSPDETNWVKGSNFARSARSLSPFLKCRKSLSSIEKTAETCPFNESQIKRNLFQSDEEEVIFYKGKDIHFSNLFDDCEDIVKEGPLRQKRRKGKLRKTQVYKTIYLTITTDARLICRKGHRNKFKVLFQVNLGESEYIDVALIGDSADGTGFDFAVSFNNHRKLGEMGGLRFLAANEDDAKTWARCIRETWKETRKAKYPEATNTDTIEQFVFHYGQEHLIC